MGEALASHYMFKPLEICLPFKVAWWGSGRG